MKEIIKHGEYDCELAWGQYGNGNIAIQLFDIEDGQPVAVATVNPDCEIKLPNVVIKTWSENAGIDRTLVAAGVIKTEPHAWITLGFCEAQVYELTEAALINLKEKMGEE